MKTKSVLRARASIAAAVFAGVCGLAGQDIQHQVSVINIEIPVRVYRGDAFVDSLGFKDFEVLDNGRPQAIEAIYLIRKTEIARTEGKRGNAPQVSRQFILFFEMTEYMPEIDAALGMFFDKVYLPGDSLMIVTPTNRYHLRDEAVERKTRSMIKDELKAKLLRDILIGNSEYQGLIRQLKSSMVGSASLEEKLQLYSDTLTRLESMRKVNEKGLIEFAGFLRDLPGQKYVFLFYQKERIPSYDWKQLMQVMDENQADAARTFKLMENFQMFQRDVDFDVEAIKRAYADSSISVHFLFMTRTLPENADVSDDGSSGLTMVEQSADVFSAFREVAAATGGITDSSVNLAASFARAVDASENYYLIYYKPRDYKADGTFHKITVRVISGNYRVAHRAGYIAR
jgi:VWFA-related protein